MFYAPFAIKLWCASPVSLWLARSPTMLSRALSAFACRPGSSIILLAPRAVDLFPLPVILIRMRTMVHRGTGPPVASKAKVPPAMAATAVKLYDRPIFVSNFSAASSCPWLLVFVLPIGCQSSSCKSVSLAPLWSPTLGSLCNSPELFHPSSPLVTPRSAVESR